MIIFQPILLWFFLSIILFIGELFTTLFVLLFFSIGALITSLAVVLNVAPTSNLQLIIFIISSILSLLLFRKNSKNLFKVKKCVIKNDTFIGNKALVVEDINPNTLSGKVELFGTNWAATADEQIHKGSVVEIIGQSNLTLKVKL